MKRSVRYGLFLLGFLGTIGLIGCAWLGPGHSSSEEGASSGKGMVCVYRLSSPDEYGAERKAEVELNEKVVCTLAPGEYWSGLCGPGQISISVSVNYSSVEQRGGRSLTMQSCELEPDQVLYLRARVPKHRNAETERPFGLVTGKAEEIKGCICDGREFSPVENVPEGNSIIYIYRLSFPDERGPDYPSVIYVNDKPVCTLRPGEYCVHVSDASEIWVLTTLHRHPLVDDGIPTVIGKGGSCSVDGSPTSVMSCSPKEPGEVKYIRVIYPKDLVFQPPYLIERGTLDEMTGCQPVQGR